ncbi:hypothetical protein LJC23_06330 [Desulfovibrio sp. OttesenSCG-928-I05]|nr:hypothetical protein [Desulfovibrio sp. OttesenSCG-928-I05]
MKRTRISFFRVPALFFFLTLAGMFFERPSGPFAASPEQMRQAEADFRELAVHDTRPPFMIDGRRSYVITPALRAEIECAEISGPQYTILREKSHTETDSLTRQPPALVDTTGTRAVFLNLKRDLTKGDVRPYVHGGLGVAYDHALEKDEAAVAVFGNTPTVESGSDPQDARIAWSAGLGMDLQAAEDVQVDLGYRMAGSDGSGKNHSRSLPATAMNPTFSADPSGETTHLFSVGVSIGF